MRLSDNQRWLLESAYDYYCRVREAVPADFDPEVDAPDKADVFSTVNNMVMSNLTAAFKGGERQDSPFMSLPTPKPGLRHFLLPRLVGHIAGIPEPDKGEYWYREECWHGGYSDYANNFYITDRPHSRTYYVRKEWRLTQAEYNRAYASASRTVKRLEQRQLLNQYRRAIYLTKRGIEVAAEITGIEPTVRGWELWSVVRDDAGKVTHIKYDPENAYWLKDCTAVQTLNREAAA